METDRYKKFLEIAFKEALAGFEEGGIPIGAAIFDASGQLVGKGRNQRIQKGDPSLHAETDAFRNAGRRNDYGELTMVSTLAPCWYCSGLVRQFGFRQVVIGEAVNFDGGIGWLRESGITVVDLKSRNCIDLLATYIERNPEIWNEDIGIPTK